jgi:hypothetical protein
MTIQEAINRLDAEFQETPLGFTVETALQARLLELLRAKVGETIQVRGGYNTADTTGYRRKYLDRIAKPQSISSVQPEVNFGMSGERSRSLDIAILAKLGNLSNAESRHLIVVSKKNPFQQGEADSRNTVKAQRRYERVNEECKKRGVELT